MPVQWVKAKYTRDKTVGRYRSSHNDQGTRSKNYRKASDAVRADQLARRPAVTLVVLPSGRRRFVRVYPTTQLPE
jgi:hypothetical protein